MKHTYLLLAMILLFSCTEQKKIITNIEFKEDTLSILKNPCMGWGVYDDANDSVQNADLYWKMQDEASKKYASFFYIRWRWSEMEPEEGKYAWIYNENYKKLIKGALDRGLKLCFRIYNNSQDNLSQSTPDYVRKAGAKGYMVTGLGGKQLWTPYPDDPIFLDKLEKFVQAFAKEYDNPDIVDFIDAYNIGWWGECHHIQLSNDKISLETVFDKITSIYSDNFHQVLLVLPFGSQVGFTAEKEIAIDRKGYSIRRDGLGSMWFSEQEQHITQDLYGKTLFIGESCWWGSCSDECKPFASDQKYKLKTWRDVYELTYEHALRGHFNTLDLREIPETTGWTTKAKDLVMDFCIKGGYRIYPTQIAYPQKVCQNDSIIIQHTWINRGNGYLPNNVKNWGYKYKPAFAFIDKGGNVIKTFVDLNAEPSIWLSNQKHSYDFKFSIDKIVPGEYILGVAMTDKNKNWTPAINLAIDKAEMINGWYVVGKIDIQ